MTHEFLTVLPIICLMIIAVVDKHATKYKKALLLTILSLITLLTFVNYIEFSIASLSAEEIFNPILIDARFLCSNILYVLRPLLLAFICIYFSDLEPKLQFMLLIPAGLCALQFIVNQFYPFVFYISESNNFSSYHTLNLSHFTVLVYITIFLAFAIIEAMNASLAEIIAIAVVTITLVTGLVIDYLSWSDSFAHAIVIAFAMYYLVILVTRSNQTIKQHELELENRKNSLMISQIQSHFVFNTLNTIYALAAFDVESARDLLLKFSAYLKDNINFSKQEEPFITIEQELTHTKIYSDIEAVRFPKVKVEYDIQDEDFFVPPLTIQPMVENAIKHGVNGPKGGNVKVSLYRDETNHYIIIKDNGKGVATKSDKKHHTGIGLTNVKARVEELCHGTFSIELVENVGATVTITIPVDQP